MRKTKRKRLVFYDKCNKMDAESAIVLRKVCEFLRQQRINIYDKYIKSRSMEEKVGVKKDFIVKSH